MRKSWFLALGIASSIIAPFGVTAATVKSSKELVVYKSPTCGCCGAWIQHMKNNGFTVTFHDVKDVQPYKKKYGVPSDMASCHTAIIDGYVVEGHVPAADVKRLLKERPQVIGLAVPGMPVGSPGMEMGNRKDPYDTVAIQKDGSVKVFQAHR